MNTSMITVGCDKYTNLNNLSGAENDAKSIYKCLIESKSSIYKQQHSIVLESPILSVFRDSLKKVLINNENAEIFTFYFAGHGGIFNGEYYMCLKDTDNTKLGLTALSLSEVLRSITSLDIQHINIILDSCNAGGVVHDLASIIKPEIMGEKGSLSISILNAAASNELALEDVQSKQGILTGNLLKLIDGTKIVTSESEYLDLISIGNILSKNFDQDDSILQSPSSWGLNLFTSSVFVKNPFFKPFNSVGTQGFLNISPSSKLGQVIEEFKEELSSVYDAMECPNSQIAILEIMQRIIYKVNNIDEVLVIIESIGFKFIDKAYSIGLTKQLEIINTICTILIEFLPNMKCSLILDKLISLFNSNSIDLLRSLNVDLNNDKNALMIKGNDSFELLASYYYLPIKISKLLGCLSQILLINKEAVEPVEEMLKYITKYYKKHLVCVSDIQMPYLHSFFSIANSIDNLRSFGKECLFEYLKDFFISKGRVSKISIEPENALQFLLHRHSEPNIKINLLANPNGLGASLFLSAIKLDLVYSIDMQMHHLDRLNFNIFIPVDIKTFGTNPIEKGYNLVMECGKNFWDCKDFNELISTQVNQYSKINFGNIDIQTKFACIASSFIQPNRMPIMLDNFS